MMPAQYVKPFVKTNKNDAADARAIVKAMDRPDMRFVQVKTTEQQTVLLALLGDQIEALDKAVIAVERDINTFFKQNEACQRLAEIPGIGVLTATAFVATIGDTRQFRGVDIWRPIW